jgi:pyrroloquinoline quinone (PQQ) biosynthesis protein C
VNRDEFQSRLLDVMEKKDHWAWSAFGDGTVAKDKLHHHFEQEYAVYVRDFPVLIGRAYVQCPIASVRRELAENLYEEETGGLSGGKPHPDLFLLYPQGLGMDVSRFDKVKLLPNARAFRALLDRGTTSQGWEVAAALTTLFLEGTKYERGELDDKAPKRPETPLQKHPLVVHYGLPLANLELTKTHRRVEGGHRKAAWTVMLDHVPEERREAVLSAMDTALVHWLFYRDDVANACGLARGANGKPSRR